MTDVRACPSCRRPNGSHLRRCMYCGADLPAMEPGGAASEPTDVDVLAEAEKARSLLAGLSPEARALMPDAVIRKLEAQVAVGDSVRAPRRGPITAEIARPAWPQPPPPSPDSVYDVPEPSPEGDPSIPNLSADEMFDVASVRASDLEPYESLRMARAELLAEFEDTIEEEGPRDPQDAPDPQTGQEALRLAMTRGAGPFGRREAPARLILMPDPAYRGHVQWLRHRLCQALGLDLFTSGQVLQRDVPAFLGSADTFEEAEALADTLRDGGLRILTIDRDGWLDDALPEPVVAATAEGACVRFYRADGSDLLCPRDDLSWAATGEIAPDPVPPPSPPDGGRKPAEKPPPRSLEIEGGPYLVMDILRRSTRRPIRIRSDDFDFSCLGDGRTLAAALNLRVLLGWVAQDPEMPLPLDEHFRRVPHVAAGPAAEAAVASRTVPSREVEFTEYVLLVDAPNHV